MTKTNCPRCGGDAAMIDKAPKGESGDVVRCRYERTCVALSDASARLASAKNAVSDLAAEVADEGFQPDGRQALREAVKEWRVAGDAFLKAFAKHGRAQQ